MTRNTLIAWGALAATVTIWASFLVSTRAAVASPLGPVEVGIMRFGTATLLFLPVYLRDGLLPGGARPRDALLIAGLGGFAFILFLSNGLRFAPVADAGVFTPSMLPIYVALLSVLFLGERFGRSQILGFGLIVLGALAVGGWEALHGGTDGAWRGHLLFSAASMAWAAYTVAFRMSGLSALHAAALMCFWTSAGMLVLAAVFGTRFGEVPVPTLALQVFLQGVLSGFLATFTYGFAISRLGASRTASFAALVPVLAALGGWAVLGEPLSWLKGLGIAVVAAGVVLASRRP
jgi:drug/metabolite transporter (DMT)-like permease